jgi:hypothetical protein
MDLHRELLARPSAHMSAWVTAGTFSVLAVVVSVQLIRQHQRSFSRPALQSKICGILWMVPIYALDSWLSLRFKDIATYLDMLRDCYEGYVIYLFLALLVSYLADGAEDGEEVVIRMLEAKGTMRHPFPMTHVWSPIQLGRDFLFRIKLAVMQVRRATQSNTHPTSARCKPLAAA